MLLDDYDYSLPEELIAQYPAERRDGSRLMLVDRENGTCRSGRFAELPAQLHAGDLLVLNDTRVIPARLLGTKASGGRIEVFLTRRLSGDEERWLCMTRSSRPPRTGSKLELGDGLSATVAVDRGEGFREIVFHGGRSFEELLQQYGRMPLPPYIRRESVLDDAERYQTVFARNPGALAAPTAGLHFSEEILAELRQRGVETAPLTLHVGLGTFLPVRSGNLDEHRMHREDYLVPEATANAVNTARREGRRVIALGTTAIRALESAVNGEGELVPGPGATELFIRPGYRFRLVDALVTNFHLPKSTLLMLVAAFAGRELVLQAYRQAVAERFRFFSYGDCMLIV